MVYIYMAQAYVAAVMQKNAGMVAGAGAHNEVVAYSRYFRNSTLQIQQARPG
jgi:hypothetical protein